MTTRQLTPAEKKIVRRTWRQCGYPWPEGFQRPKVEAESRGGFGYYDYRRNVIVVNDLVMRMAADGDRIRRKQVKATILHECFHAIDYQLLNNEGRRRLATVLHEGVDHGHAPEDTEYPWGTTARDEDNWTDHGHAWWDSDYSQSLMEASADVFVQAFSTLTSQTAGRWVHTITPEIEAEFKRVLLEIT